jgi:hypothetical protein
MSTFEGADNPPDTIFANPTFIEFTNPVGAGDFDDHLPPPAAGAMPTVDSELDQRALW